MARSLPSLNALRAFESAARHLSFTKAAHELNVTPAAISHQIKALEELLGVSLFQRQPRSLSLTIAGRTFLPKVSQGFDNLADAVEQLRSQNNIEILSISVSPSFGSSWLVPRLEQFRNKHPDIEIRIDATESLVEPGRNNIDVAVRYGPGGYENLHVDYLFKQVNTPVCSPALLKGKHPLQQPADLRHHTLLHVDWKSTDASWHHWLQSAGLTDIDSTRGPHYTMESMAVQAALDGQGVALTGDLLVADEIASGRLLHPFDPELSTELEFSYYLLSAKHTTELPKVTAFRNWLIGEAQGMRS